MLAKSQKIMNRYNYASYSDPFTRLWAAVHSNASADVVDWRNEIGITGNYDEGICTIFVKVHHHGSREVDI